MGARKRAKRAFGGVHKDTTLLIMIGILISRAVLLKYSCKSGSELQGHLTMGFDPSGSRRGSRNPEDCGSKER